MTKVSQSIPAKKALEDGCDKLIIVLTQPRGFVKHFGKYDKMGARILGRKYPEMKQQIADRLRAVQRDSEVL